jgi:hypothetical protein
MLWLEDVLTYGALTKHFSGKYMVKNVDERDSVIQISQYIFIFLFSVPPIAPNPGSPCTVPALRDNKSRRVRSILLLTLWCKCMSQLACI